MCCPFRAVAIVGGWPEKFLIHAKWLGFPDKFLATLILLKRPNPSIIANHRNIRFRKQHQPLPP
jgi:hypothetical protein